MNNPLFWLGVSILLVAISLMALLTVAILTLQELARAARSAEKLLDTLNKELPPTLNDLRLTGKELSQLSDEVSGSVQSARNVVEQVDKGLIEAKVQAQRAGVTTRSLVAGTAAALNVLMGRSKRRRQRPPTRRPPIAAQQPSTQKTLREPTREPLKESLKAPLSEETDSAEGSELESKSNARPETTTESERTFPAAKTVAPEEMTPPKR